MYNYKNRVLACFQTRPRRKIDAMCARFYSISCATVPGRRQKNDASSVQWSAAILPTAAKKKIDR